MNTSNLEALLIDLEIAHNDCIPEAPAHFRPQAVGAILEKVPLLITMTRQLIAQSKEERRDTFEAGRDSVDCGPSVHWDYRYTFEEWESTVPPELPELDKPPDHP